VSLAARRIPFAFVTGILVAVAKPLGSKSPDCCSTIFSAICSIFGSGFGRSGSATSSMARTSRQAPGALCWKVSRQSLCSSEQLICLKEIGAGEGIRTLDTDLGKVVLYP
jgi:hypothetical protein